MVQRQKAAREQRRVQELERRRLRRVTEEARQRDEAEARRRREELAREQQRLAALAQIQAEAVVLLQVRGATCWYYLLRCLWSNWEHLDQHRSNLKKQTRITFGSCIYTSGFLFFGYVCVMLVYIQLP
jgi:small-conductance mechanosensitive channel